MNGACKIVSLVGLGGGGGVGWTLTHETSVLTLKKIFDLLKFFKVNVLKTLKPELFAHPSILRNSYLTFLLFKIMEHFNSSFGTTFSVIYLKILARRVAVV
jgi:hypothetical protein